MGRARGHLRLIDPDEVPEPEPVDTAPVEHISGAAAPADADPEQTVFQCLRCGRTKPIGRTREAWCTGGLRDGVRTHAPIQMIRKWRD